MRVDVEKYLVIGPRTQRDPFFEAAQKLGIAEFIRSDELPKEVPSDVQTYVEALHILRTMTSVKQITTTTDYRSGIVLARYIVDRHRDLERLGEQKRVLEKEIARVKIFGHFSVSELKQIEEQTHRKIQFFFAKKSELLEAPKRPEVIYVGSAYGLDYFIAINREPTSYPGLVEIHIEKSVGELNGELASINRLIDEYETEIAASARQKKLIKEGLIEALNKYHLNESKERAENHLEGGLFAVEMWIPQNKIPQMQMLEKKHAVYMEPISVEKKDRVPTYLENKGPARLGEDLVGIYDVPSTQDNDPSLWVFFAFGLFFSLIVADAGYGLILLGISLFLLFKFGKKQGLVRRILLLSASLSIGCIVWGILSASYLGIEVPLESPLRRVSLIDWMVKKKTAYVIQQKDAAYQEWIKQFPQLKEVQDPQTFLLKGIKSDGGKVKYTIYKEYEDNVLLELVIFIGTSHIILSFIRNLDKNWSGFGWILFMIGGYLYFPSLLKATSLIHYLFGVPFESGAHVGIYLIFIGIGLATLLALIQKKLAGLAEPMHVIQVFADVMSYLRIYALSLAGMVMASTFNHIGTSAPLYVGIFIIIAGHSVNFVLALMGGIIHGLRLNFIEWYHYSFEGGGKPFHPLSLIKIE